MEAGDVAMKIYDTLEQGTEEWLQARCGVLTASTVGALVTPTLKVANNRTSQGLVYKLIAERITGYVEPEFVSADMEHGNLVEPVARDLYAKQTRQTVKQVGFIETEIEGHIVGYSPDGLVGDDGLIEIKSRRQKKHLETIMADKVPAENMAQIQFGLLVTGRSWCDYVSYCGGMPLFVKRVEPDEQWFNALREAVDEFELAAFQIMHTYDEATASLPTTPRADDVSGMVL